MVVVVRVDDTAYSPRPHAAGILVWFRSARRTDEGRCVGKEGRIDRVRDRDEGAGGRIEIFDAARADAADPKLKSL